MCIQIALPTTKGKYVSNKNGIAPSTLLKLASHVLVKG